MDLEDTITEQPSSGFAERCRAIWHGRVTVTDDQEWHRIRCPMTDLVAVCEWLSGSCGYVFATLVVEEDTPAWRLTYMFHAPSGGQWAEVETCPPGPEAAVPSISAAIPAADWYEREAADLFELTFAGHPRTRSFVLHEGWPDHVPLMRAGCNIRVAFTPAESTPPPTETEPVSGVPGAFAMPIGPVYSDTAESAHFRIESLGEDVNRLGLQFFYKYRAVEKLAEGQAIDAALLLAERFSGSAAFAHGLAFCQAVEAICGITPPTRALALRTMLAELERLRSHAATITGICNSTALVVASSVAAIIEEELLRLSCIVSGHRYFFGALTPGGLRADIPDTRCRALRAAVSAIANRLDRLERMLQQSSSFLDRLEEVGIVPAETATLLGLVGPVARASAVPHDMRRLFPYAAYPRHAPDVPVEAEGDGYARLRVLFREAAMAAALICDVSAALPPGPVNAGSVRPVPGVALGVVEAPLGAAFHHVRLAEDGIVRRLRISPPSFVNWRGFQWAAESFAFQDFPIILATFGLSNAENDR